MTTTLEDQHTRQMCLRADTVDAANRSVSAVVSTENEVDVFDYRTGRIIAEVLLTKGAEFPAQVPLLTDHNRAVVSQVGSVTGFTRAGGELKAILRLATGTAAADEVWNLVQQKHLRDVSVGYRVENYREISPGKTEIIGGRSFTAPTNRPLRVVSKWQIKEISLVPIGADPESGIRSANQSYKEENKVSTVLDVISGDLGSMTFAKYLAACARQRGRELDHKADDATLFRLALSHADGISDMLGLVNQAILTGFRETNDTTVGWARTTNLPNFLNAEIAAVDVAPRLEKIARGGVAPSVGFGVGGQGWRLARFGCQFQIDEQDMLDGRPINVYQIAMEEIGRAARRLLPDLVYSMLLTNSALDDGTAIFNAGRSNSGTATLAQASLDAGLAAVANQLQSDREGDPVHAVHAARYLTVPPDLFGAGKRLARDMQTGEGDIVVRSESRLGSAGVVNPTTDEIVAGSVTNWLLSSPSDQAAGVVVGALNGRLEPQVREFVLDKGEFGLGFDVVLDLAATVVGPRSLYWSDGTV